MPSAGIRAVMYVRPGPTADNQREMIIRFCERYGYTIESQCNRPEDCAQLVSDGIVDLVVATHDAHDGLKSAVREVGGRVEYVRRSRRLPSLSDLLRRWHRQGRSSEEIARFLDEDTGEIRHAMRKMGLRPQQRQPPE